MDPERPKEKQLPFHNAIRLTSLPIDIQREIALEIVHKKIPAKQARFLIQKRTHQAGISTNATRAPYHEYKIVTGFVDRLLQESKLILNMPNPTFVSILGSRSDREVAVLTNQIELAAANLQKLIDKLKTAKSVVNERFKAAG